MNPLKKYYSRYYLGLCKQATKYRNKPEVSEKLILPEIMSYNEDSGEYEPLYQKFAKRWWHDTNLAEITNLSCNHPAKTGGMYSKFRINKDGKYELTREGQRILKKKLDAKT